MLYKDYWYAAHKHLQVCKSLISHEKSTPYELHNIFYLSGYVLECISTYIIYKHFKWDKNKDIKCKDKDEDFIKKSNFSFYRYHAHYCVQYHRFQNNQFEILRKEFGKLNIPIISNMHSIDSNMLDLFKCWNAGIRYMKEDKYINEYFKVNLINIKENNIRDFFNLTEKIFNSLTEIVGGQ